MSFTANANKEGTQLFISAHDSKELDLADLENSSHYLDNALEYERKIANATDSYHKNRKRAFFGSSSFDIDLPYMAPFLLDKKLIGNQLGMSQYIHIQKVQPFVSFGLMITLHWSLIPKDGFIYHQLTQLGSDRYLAGAKDHKGGLEGLLKERRFIATVGKLTPDLQSFPDKGRFDVFSEEGKKLLKVSIANAIGERRGSREYTKAGADKDEFMSMDEVGENVLKFIEFSQESFNKRLTKIEEENPGFVAVPHCDFTHAIIQARATFAAIQSPVGAEDSDFNPETINLDELHDADKMEHHDAITILQRMAKLYHSLLSKTGEYSEFTEEYILKLLVARPSLFHPLGEKASGPERLVEFLTGPLSKEIIPIKDGEVMNGNPVYEMLDDFHSNLTQIHNKFKDLDVRPFEKYVFPPYTLGFINSVSLVPEKELSLEHIHEEDWEALISAYANYIVGYSLFYNEASKNNLGLNMTQALYGSDKFRSYAKTQREKKAV